MRYICGLGNARHEHEHKDTWRQSEKQEDNKEQLIFLYFSVCLEISLSPNVLLIIIISMV